jgi:alpha-ribazole phosphatase
MNASDGIQRLWLVRHGATEWNSEQRFCGHSDIALSERGRAEARWLGRRLRRRTISAIYSSDLVRANQTAEIIAQQRTQSPSIRLSAAWREISFGEWEGLTYTQIAQEYPSSADFFSDPLRHAPPGGESLGDLVRRVQGAYEEITSTMLEGDIVLVSHGGPLRALLCCLLGIPLERQWQLRLEPGSLSAIDRILTTDVTSTMVTLALFNEQCPIDVNNTARATY